MSRTVVSRLLAFGVLVVASLSAGLLSASQAATTVTVSGFVFRDLDNDGVRDAGEPGVPGLRVHKSNGNNTPNAVTNADGSYTVTGLTPQSSGFLVVKAGWFRSQCTKLTCASGPGADNDYATANAFLQYPLAQITANTTNLNVGLIPDWPGSSASPPAPVGGVIAANAVDVAARLSWTKSTCPGGTYNICGIGDTFSVSNQIHNQGTTALTGITAVLDLPAGDRFATGNSTKDVSLVAATSSPGITGITVSGIDTSTQSVTIDLIGSLPPGGAAIVSANGVLAGGPGTPGCVVNAVASSCPKVEPQGAALTLAITHVDQTGDADSFGPDCAGVPITSCSTGIHDKQVEPDEVDPVGHNVAASVGGNTGINLTSALSVLNPRAPLTAPPGSSVVWRASAYNVGPATGLPGWKLTTLFPIGFKPVAPTANAVRTCVAGTTSGYPSVTCTAKSPLSPGVRSFAVDITTTVPTNATAGSTQQALTYVTPAAGQGTEANPLGSPPTNPAADAGQTSTDNDASTTFRVSSQ